MKAKLKTKGTVDNVIGGAPEGGALSSLIEDDRLVLTFPYSPTIQLQQEVQWGAIDLVHTNYQPNAFAKRSNPQITLTAPFTCHTTAATTYALGALTMMKVISSMRFGTQDPYRGVVPPILLFSAYGAQVFQDVPVILKSYSMDFPNDVDYVSAGGDSMLPTNFTLNITLEYQVNIKKVRDEYSIKDIASGKLIGQGYI